MPIISSAAGGGESSSLSLLVLLLPIALLAYLIFAQRRRSRRESRVQQQLQVGDQVMTRAGMFGSIATLDGSVVGVDVAPGVVLTFDRRTVLPATSPSASPEPDREVDPASGDEDSPEAGRE